MINAKPLMSNKFWVLEENGTKIGTLQAMDEGYILIMNGSKSYIQNEELYKKYQIKLERKSIANSSKKDETVVFEYPSASAPYNSIWNCSLNLPLYTKKPDSKSLHCAGYYIIKFDKGWVETFCPKLVTLNKYPYKGPFKNQIEARAVLVNER